MNRYMTIILIILSTGFYMSIPECRADELVMGQVVDIDRDNNRIQVKTNGGHISDETVITVNIEDGYIPSTIRKGEVIRLWLRPDRASAINGSISGRMTGGRFGRCDCTGIRSRLKRSVSMGRGGSWAGRAGHGRHGR
jgi:integrase